ncbi:MAG: methionine--tRNA ligase subunit beta [Patescibacteria group bacterium]|nr:methionine--tRNA ligase subunit beta [Patescibacteria group bacterium]
MTTIDDFTKLEIKIGKIISAEKIEGSEKLLKLEVDFGTEKRQIVSGIAKEYNPEDLIGKECPFIINLEPRTLMGVESQGMIMAVKVGEEAVLLFPEKEAPPGSSIT